MTDTYRTVGLRALLRALAPARCRRTQSLLLGVGTLLGSQPGRVFSKQEIAEWVYGDDAGGGAECAIACVKLTIYRLRQRGMPITTHNSRGYAYDPPRPARDVPVGTNWAFQGHRSLAEVPYHP